MTPLFEGSASSHAVLLALVSTIFLAWLAAFAAGRLARRALQRLLGDHLTVSSPLVRGPLRLVSVATFVLCISVTLFPAFELAGLKPRTGVPLKTIAEWAFGHGLKTLLIGVLAYALVRTTALMVRRFEHETSRGTSVDALERGKRARTLGSLVNNVANIAIIGAAVLMVLEQFGVDITPILTGAGIAGLAVGFGAQTLVRDIITGFFLILEDQVRVGDSAAINGTGGLVEEINLRTIVLRDEEGTVHVFPNGSITTLANKSKEFSFYVISLSISVSRGRRQDHDYPARRGFRPAERLTLRRVHPRTDRDHGSGRLLGLGGAAQAADQDRAAAAARGRTGAAQANQTGVRPERRRRTFPGRRSP